ncbi:unnamed protein product [Acanthoscelides obtectus]|uniref:DDE Tnp4 domain-containing protein n=1 Tax=Acanthoscelides obtectus TaxID=200917 RepID=A0A9P0JNZ6_ACAOB|nr:unnamed protein product [Acanthoscelides obtectus]CAK1642918.1 Protein ALP1-like [Acanthoscelides obtectus]
MEIEECIAVWYLLNNKKKKLKRRRSLWVHPMLGLRESKGTYNLLHEDLLQDPSKFFNYYRMSIQSFEKLHNILENKLIKKDTTMRRSISSKERLSMTLRYLATGCSLTELHYNYRVGISTASEIIQETCKLIWIFMKEQCIPKPTREKWLEIADGFLKNANYPHCLGAIDGKHIRVIKPQHSGSLYFNYKHFFSIQLLAMCDANYCSTFVDIGDYGKNSDSSIFTNSHFYKNLSSKKLDLPNPDFLPQKNDYKIPYVIVGDEAFGLSFNVMRPYGGKNLTLKKRIHNYRLTRARRYIECTFGILSNKWRIFHRPLNVSIDFAVDIVKACTVLHNFVRVLDGYKHEDALSIQGFYDANVAKTGACSARSATAIRDYFADYFMNTDILPWQNSCIM